MFDFEKFKNSKVSNVNDHNYLINLISNGITNKLKYVKTDRLIKVENDKLLTYCGFRTREPNDRYELIYLN